MGAVIAIPRVLYVCAVVPLLTGCGANDPNEFGFATGLGGSASAGDSDSGDGDEASDGESGDGGDGDGDGDGEAGDGDGDGDAAECTTDPDCEGSSNGSLCNPDTGLCVVCMPAITQPCYGGQPMTQGVGSCVGGTQTCADDGSGFGECEGDVIPISEICGNQIDDDCNGVLDDNNDLDQDGWGTCDGDCCDFPSGFCLDPELVNPGAYEVYGNDVDDDCDDDYDEVAPTCNAGLAENSNDPDDFARAMELCQFTTIDAAPADKVWGVIDARIALPNGAPLAHWEQVGIPSNYGPNQPPANEAMVVLSSGWASDAAASAEWGQGWGVLQDAPADWLSHHGGFLPKNPGCGQNGKRIRDPAMLEVTVRAPTNALSFAVDVNFFNAEYPEWVCGQYQDMFVALIDGASDLNPVDSNIAIYNDGMGGFYPIGVNLARDSGLFRQCAPASNFGCMGSGGTQQATSCEGMDQLIGTPYGANDPGCGGGHTYSGGATGWLTMSGNVEPGEVFTLKMFVFDAGESGSGLADALVMLDNWRWELEASEPGVIPQ